MIEGVVLGVIGSVIASAILGNDRAGDILGAVISFIVFISIIFGILVFVTWQGWMGFFIVSAVILAVSIALTFYESYGGFFDAILSGAIFWVPGILTIVCLFIFTKDGGFSSLGF